MLCNGEAALAAFSERALAGAGLFLLMEDASRLVLDSLRADLSAIFELSGDEESLLLRAGAGWAEGLVGRAVMPAGEDSPGGYTLRAGEPIAVADFAAEHRFAAPALLRNAGIASGIMVAIRGRGRPSGIFGAYASVPRRFTNNEIHFLQSLANVLAAVVDRKRFERQLRESEHLYRTIASNLPGGVVALFDRDLRYLAVEGAGLASAGLSKEALEGKSPLEALPEAAAAIEPVYRAALAGDTVTTELALRDRVYLLQTAPVRNEDGEIVAGISTALDITATRKIEQDLKRSNRELEQFAYVASHDLREPLRMVASYVQLLGRRYRGKLDAEADEFIAFAVDGVTRMQQMIEGLLELSRTARGPAVLRLTSCSAALDRALLNLKSVLDESGGVVSRGELPEIPADPVQLTEALQNLIGNALKFRGEEPPRIHVAAERRGGEWVFSVRDNGIGIDREHAGRIFEIFQRLHERGRYAGAGIGLAVTKRIIERHGGRIWVESEPGRGATFYFTLPASVRQAA